LFRDAGFEEEVRKNKIQGSIKLFPAHLFLSYHVFLPAHPLRVSWPVSVIEVLNWGVICLYTYTFIRVCIHRLYVYMYIWICEKGFFFLMFFWFVRFEC
jgi:hypothetical protein